MTIDGQLLVISPVTPVAAIRNNGDLEDGFEIVVADHNRDRGQLRELSGAVKQLEKNQGDLDRDCKARAEKRAQTLREAAKETVKIKRPIWKGWW